MTLRNSSNLYLALVCGAVLLAIGLVRLGKFVTSYEKSNSEATHVVTLSEGTDSNEFTKTPLSYSQVDAILKSLITSEIKDRAKHTSLNIESYQPISINIDQKNQKVIYEFLYSKGDKKEVEQYLVKGEASYMYKDLPQIRPLMDEKQKEKIRNEIYKNPLGVVFFNRSEQLEPKI